MSNAQFKIVLFSPEIPGNTGTIGRTCLALNLELILIKPYGFEITDKSLRRAGLDYWKHVKLKEYNSWDDFISAEKPSIEQLFFLSTKSDVEYFDADFSDNCYIVFGQETKGLPSEFFGKYDGRFYKLPMLTDKIRSLNLANTATAVAYEAYKQIRS